MIWVVVAITWGSWFLTEPWYVASLMVVINIVLTDYICLKFYGFGVKEIWK